MSPDIPRFDSVADARDQQRHALIAPLTTISGRTQLVMRQIQRTASLSDLDAIVNGTPTL